MSWLLFILGTLAGGLAIREWRSGNGSPGIFLTLCILTTVAWIGALANGNLATELILGIPAALAWSAVIVKARKP